MDTRYSIGLDSALVLYYTLATYHTCPWTIRNYQLQRNSLFLPSLPTFSILPKFSALQSPTSINNLPRLPLPLFSFPFCLFPLHLLPCTYIFPVPPSCPLHPRPLSPSPPYSISNPLHLMVEIIKGIHRHAVLTAKVQEESIDGILVTQDKLGDCRPICSKQNNLEYNVRLVQIRLTSRARAFTQCHNIIINAHQISSVYTCRHTNNGLKI